MNLDPATRVALEMLYRVLLSAVVQLAAVLGKESPVQSRAARRQARQSVLE